MFPDKSFYRFVPYLEKLAVDHYIQPIHTITDISVVPFQNIQTQNNYSFTNNKVSIHLPYD